MSENTNAPTSEELLTHSAFLKRLARSLIPDEHLAEDTAQDALVAAIENPPPASVGLRQWLIGITRNLSRMKARTAVRRTRRELGSRHPDGAPSAAEIVERIDIQRKVAEAVRSLDEPYRTVIVLRYFDDMDPQEISDRLEIPRQTVYTRLRRAHERLQASLDDSHEGERAHWVAALLPLLEIPPGSRTPGPSIGASAISAGTIMAVGGVVVVASVVAALLWISPGSRASDPPPIGSENKSTETAAVGRQSPGNADGRTAAESTPAATSRMRGFARVSGRVLDGEGAVMSGVTVELSASTTRGEPVLFDRLQTGEDGGFDLRQLRRQAVNEFLTLIARKEGYVPERAQLATARSGVEFRLRKGHPVTVKVVDQKGKPCVGITVCGYSSVRRTDLWTRIVVRHGTDEAGLATLLLPAGLVSVAVEVHDGRYGAIKHEVVPGSEEIVTLVLPEGVTVLGRVVEKGSGLPIAGVSVYRGEGPPTCVTDSDGRFEVTFQPSSQSITFIAPWHFHAARKPLTFRRTPPGSVVEQVFELEPASQVTGTVIDASGRPVEGAWVATGPARASNAAHGSTSPATANAVRSDAQGRFHLKGVFSSARRTLHAEILGGPRGWSEPFTTEAGKVTRDVLIRFPESALVVIVPVMEDGQSPDGCRATATTRNPDDADPRQFRPSARGAYYRDGDLRLCCPTDGEVDITITAPGHLPVTIPLSKLRSTGCSEDRPFEVKLEVGLAIAGICQGHGGEPLARVTVSAHATVPNMQVQSSRTDQSGRFRITGLAPGKYRLVASGAAAPEGRIEGEVVAAGEESVVISAVSRCSLEGEFRDVSGRLLQGTVIGWKEPAPEGPHDIEMCGEYLKGSFRMKITPGDWWIGLQAMNGTSPTLRPVRITIREGRNVFPKRSLPEEYHRIIGTVRGPGGPISGASVAFWPAELPQRIESHMELHSDPRSWAETGPGGKFAIGPLGAGRWKLTVRAPGHLGRTAVVDVPEGGGEVTQDLMVGLGAFLSVRMTDPTGERMRGWVRLTGPDGETLHPIRGAKPATGREPGFSLVGAFPPGEYGGEAVGTLRFGDPRPVRVRRKVTVRLRTGEVTRLELQFTQEEIDQAVKSSDNR